MSGGRFTMNNKPYRLGILVGRFQTLHSGHTDMINRAIELCDKVGIFVGSSNESGTSKNPFSYETREDMLKTVFGNEVFVFPLPDIGVGNNSTWGDYVLKNVVDRFGEMPDLLVSGKEARRVSWLDSVDGASIAELYIPKTSVLSEPEMRDFLINDECQSWKKYTDSKLWGKYEKLRQEVLLSKDNSETHSI